MHLIHKANHKVGFSYLVGKLFEMIIVLSVSCCRTTPRGYEGLEFLSWEPVSVSIPEACTTRKPTTTPFLHFVWQILLVIWLARSTALAAWPKHRTLKKVTQNEHPYILARQWMTVPIVESLPRIRVEPTKSQRVGTSFIFQYSLDLFLALLPITSCQPHSAMHCRSWSGFYINLTSWKSLKIGHVHHNQHGIKSVLWVVYRKPTDVEPNMMVLSTLFLSNASHHLLALYTKHLSIDSFLGWTY